jgi:hypothetical protein
MSTQKRVEQKDSICLFIRLFSNLVATIFDKRRSLLNLGECYYITHPLSPSLVKRGGTKGGEFKESVGFVGDMHIKDRTLACPQDP